MAAKDVKELTVYIKAYQVAMEFFDTNAYRLAPNA